MAYSSTSRISSIIVTLAAIFTVIGVVFTIWTWYWRPTTELQASVEYGTYQVDPWTAVSMSADSKKLHAIITELYNYRIDGGKLSAPLERYSHDAFELSNPDSIRLDSSQTYGYIKTVILDEGDLGAKDVALRVPNTVGSLVTFDDGSKKVFGPSPTLELGDLKAEQKVTVYSWLLSPPIFFLSDDANISLTYAGGKGAVEIPGRHNMAYRTFMSPFMGFFYVLGGLWLLLGVWRLGLQQGKSQNEPKPDSTSSNRDVSDVQ